MEKSFSLPEYILGSLIKLRNGARYSSFLFLFFILFFFFFFLLGRKKEKKSADISGRKQKNEGINVTLYMFDNIR